MKHSVSSCQIHPPSLGQLSLPQSQCMSCIIYLTGKKYGSCRVGTSCANRCGRTTNRRPQVGPADCEDAQGAAVQGDLPAVPCSNQGLPFLLFHQTVLSTCAIVARTCVQGLRFRVSGQHHCCTFCGTMSAYTHDCITGLSL